MDGVSPGVKTGEGATGCVALFNITSWSKRAQLTKCNEIGWNIKLINIDFFNRYENKLFVYIYGEQKNKSSLNSVPEKRQPIVSETLY